MEKLTFSQTGELSMMAESAFGDYRVWGDYRPIYADKPELVAGFNIPLQGVAWAFLEEHRLYAGFDIDEAFKAVNDDFAWRIGK